MSWDFDVIVVGAGHAGIEACLASARLGLRTAMITTNLDRIGYMSCNPSIGGLAKGHMVREIDALGGEMGIVADATCIQFKRLNSGKGPAVRGSRVQSDKDKYSERMSGVLRTQENLSVIHGEVKSLVISSGTCEGVMLNDGAKLRSRAVILTTGTFMNGVMHVGNMQTKGGRVGDSATTGLSNQLKENGFEVRRLKTGTPARLLRASIDFGKTIEQFGDSKFYPFSTRSPRGFQLPQVACHLSRTTEQTHEIIRRDLHLSPMYCGIIEGVGPRYCPSIEDKIVRFADRDSHQTFLEPEGLASDLIYLQGISTSLPEVTQLEFLQTIPGLENVKVARFGYAVEYDYFEPTQIFHRLETRTIKNLFLAGQINGTSGYEEAAAQGLVAGINASRLLLGKEEFVLGRDEAYIGVLIDDLVSKGTREPYRMFTSRAEHRLILREDNTLDRLNRKSEEVGIVAPEELERRNGILDSRRKLMEGLNSTFATPTKSTQDLLIEMGTRPLLKSVSYSELLRRPEVGFNVLERLGFEVDTDPTVLDAVEIEVKYAGYIKRQVELIEQAKKFEELRLDSNLDYSMIRGLSNEEVEKLNRVKPRSLGQAKRVSGVNPSGIQSIMIHLRGKGKTNGKQDTPEARESS